MLTISFNCLAVRLCSTTPLSNWLKLEREVAAVSRSGEPDCSRPTPVISHPSNNFRTTGFPGFPSSGRPGPKGSSYTKFILNPCRRSHGETPLSLELLRSVEGWLKTLEL